MWYRILLCKRSWAQVHVVLLQKISEFHQFMVAFGSKGLSAKKTKGHWGAQSEKIKVSWSIVIGVWDVR